MIQLIQFVCFLIEEFLDVLGPFLHTGLFQQVLLLRCTLITHLSLQVLDLLLQEIVSLLLVNVVTRLVADVEFQVLQVNLAIHDTHGVEQTLLHGVHLQQLHLLLRTEGQVRTDEIQRHDIVGHVLQRKLCLVGNLITHADILAYRLAQVFHCSLELNVALVGLFLRHIGDVALQIGVIFRDILQLDASQSLHNGGNIAVGQRQGLQYLTDYTIVEKIRTYGHLYLCISLGEDAYEYVFLLGLADECHTRLTTDKDG